MTLLKKTGKFSPVLVATLLIALAIVGFSYAHWSAILTINGTVTTGDLCARFTTPLQHVDDGVDWTCGTNFTHPDPEPRLDEKDYGNCTFVKIDDQTLEANFTNVYPSYYECLTLHIVNCGSIPWKIWRVNFTSPAGELSLYKSGYFTWDLTGDGKADVEVNYLDWIDQQVDPGQTIEISIWIHFLQDIPQNAQIPITIEFEIINWNESP